MPKVKQTIAGGSRWHVGVKAINFEPNAANMSLIEDDANATLYLQRGNDGTSEMAARAYLLGPYAGPHCNTAEALELTPWNVINVVSLGADPTGRTPSAAIINKAIEKAAARRWGRVYIPAGRYLIEDSIIMESMIWLHGDGMASVLYAKDQLNKPMLKAYWDIGSRWGYMQRISDLRLFGNRDNQADDTGSVCHGIEWAAPNSAGLPAFEEELVDGLDFHASDSSDGEYFDTNRDAFNVWISHCAGTGFYQSGRGGGHFFNITAYECKGDGFRPTYDTAWTACTAGRNGKRGFWITESAVMLTGCKAWWSGYRHPSSGWNEYDSHGFAFTSNTRGAVAVACQAQDNHAAGYSFNSVYGHSCYDCIADSNNRRNGDSVAVDFYNSFGCRWTGQIYDRYNDNIRYQDYALKLIGSNGNYVRATHYYFNGGAALQYDQYNMQHFSPSSTSLQGNDIQINNQGGLQKVGTGGGTVTISPYHGGDVLMNLTQNVTINAETTSSIMPGAKFRFTFVQDGTGGRTVTWGSQFRLANWSPTTTANKINVIEFTYNHELSKWIESFVNHGV